MNLTEIIGKNIVVRYAASTEDPPLPTRPSLYQELSSYRSRRENEGVNVMGVTIKTDEGSIAKMIGTFIALQQGLVTTVNWKGKNGWLNDADAATIQQIAVAVTSHVQACFTAERDVQDLINELAPNEVAGFDVAAAWQSVGGP